MEINPWKFGQKTIHYSEIQKFTETQFTNFQFKINFFVCFIPMKIKLQLRDGMDGAQLTWSPLFQARFLAMPIKRPTIYINWNSPFQELMESERGDWDWVSILDLFMLLFIIFNFIQISKYTFSTVPNITDRSLK